MVKLLPADRTALESTQKFLRQSFKLQPNDWLRSLIKLPLDRRPLDKSNQIYATLKNCNHALLNWQG